jgi:hypothetical protein
MPTAFPWSGSPCLIVDIDCFKRFQYTTDSGKNPFKNFRPQMNTDGYGFFARSWASFSFYSHAFSVNGVVADPAIDSASVVPDLEAASLPGLDQVEVLKAICLAEDNVPDL